MRNWTVIGSIGQRRHCACPVAASSLRRPAEPWENPARRVSGQYDNGYCILYKRLHQALFELPTAPASDRPLVTIDARALAMILRGAP